MQTASGLPIRKRIRLGDFHYSSECAYYITVNANNRRQLFGRCENDIVTLNETGDIVRDEWMRTFTMRKCVSGEHSIVMPNHMHAMISLWGLPEDNPVFYRRELFRIVGGFKAAVTSQIRKLRRDAGFTVWQPRFNDHIVRNYEDYVRIAAYIADNPRRWCARRDL
jgi:REP element-mobilizing transposase RayT